MRLKGLELFNNGLSYFDVHRINLPSIRPACKRLLWCGEKRTLKTIRAFFDWFGKERSGLLTFVCSDRMNHCLPHVETVSYGNCF